MNAANPVDRLLLSEMDEPAVLCDTEECGYTAAWSLVCPGCRDLTLTCHTCRARHDSPPEALLGKIQWKCTLCSHPMPHPLPWKPL